MNNRLSLRLFRRRPPHVCVVRQTSVEVIERKTAAAERISQHLSPRLLERLSALPEIQARQQNGEEPGQAIVATLLGAWANAVATGQVHGFYV